MRNRPRLVVTCGRCGKPRTGLRHDCITSSGRASGRRATLKPSISFGKCPACKKRLGNPLTHVCAPKSDFKARKSRAEKRAKTAERERARKKRQSEQHPFESCRDDSCKRPMCVAYRSGWHEGHFAGFDEGFAAGFGAGFAAGHEEGFKEGLASCPGPHGSGN